MKIFEIINIVNQFVTERNWWSFHNPKNDAMNMLIEGGELAEQFVNNSKTNLAKQLEITDEIADVLFATLTFAIVTKTNIVAEIANITEDSTLNTANLSYDQLQILILNNLAKFEIQNIPTPTQAVLSLIAQIGYLADLFNWQTEEQSIARAQAKANLVGMHIAHIIAHLVLMSALLKIDLPTEFKRKIHKTAAKYPVDKAQGDKYIAIKDNLRKL